MPADRPPRSGRLAGSRSPSAPSAPATAAAPSSATRTRRRPRPGSVPSSVGASGSNTAARAVMTPLARPVAPATAAALLEDDAQPLAVAEVLVAQLAGRVLGQGLAADPCHHLIEGARQLVGALPAPVRIALQPAHRRLVEPGRQRPARHRRRRHLVQLDAARDGVHRVAVEHLHAGQELVQHRGGREHVGPAIDRQVLDLLGRQIRRLALDGPVLGDRRLPPAHQGDAEVEHLDLAIEGQHQVVRAHVAVHHHQRAAGQVGELVGGVKRAAHLGHGARAHRRRRPQRHQVAEAHPGHVLHGEVEHAVVLAEVVDLRDGRVAQARQQLRLVEEHAPQRILAAQLGADGLERDEPLEPARPVPAREQDLAHAARLQLVQDLVSAERDPPLANLGLTRHRCR